MLVVIIVAGLFSPGVVSMGSDFFIFAYSYSFFLVPLLFTHVSVVIKPFSFFVAVISGSLPNAVTPKKLGASTLP